MHPARALLAVAVLAGFVLAGLLGTAWIVRISPREPAPAAGLGYLPEPGGGNIAARLQSGTARADYAAALRAADAVPGSPLTDLQPWILRGPRQTGGRITDLALDPIDGSLYVASASGGVWRSIDGGRTLSPAWPDQLTQPVGALAITSAGVLLAGTGEANAGGGSTTFSGTGLYRSTDSGASWEAVGLADSKTIARILTHPTDPDIAWVAAGGDLFGPGGQRGIYRTRNGGESWQQVLAGATPTAGGADLALDPADPQHLLATMWDRQRTPSLRRYGGPGSGLYQSFDGGTSWGPVSDGIPGFTDDAGRIAVSLSPADPLIGYAVVTRGDGRGDGLYRSTNGGSSWTLATDSSTYLASQFIFGWWFSKVFAAPDDPDRVIVPGLSLLESRDGGQTFAIDPRVHADHHALIWDPADPSRAWLGTDGGLYTSTSGGAALTWTPAVEQPFTQAYAVATPPGNTERVVAGFQDLGCMLTEGDNPWIAVGGCGDGLVVETHPDNPDEVIICGQYGRCRVTSSFDGSSDVLLTPPVDRAGWGAPLVRLPGNPDSLLFGGNTLHRSEDGGLSWRQLSPDLTRGQSPDPDYPFGTISQVLPVDTDGQDILVGTDDGLLWRTTDGGGTWARLIDGDDWVTGLTVVPGNPEMLVVGTSGYFSGEGTAQVRRSQDGGSTWSDIAQALPDAPVNEVVLIQDAVLVATDVGLYVSWDAVDPEASDPLRWRRVGAGLPQVPVIDIDHVGSAGLVTVGTFGRGVWQIRIPRTIRAAGPDRYATAVAVFDTAAGPTAETIVLASGENFPDALTAAALVARQDDWSLLLTGADSLPEVTAQALGAASPADILVVGGPAAVSESVLQQAATAAGTSSVRRIAGPDRYTTAARVADAHPPVSTVLLATAGGPFDALAGAALARAADAAVVLVDAEALPGATAEALERLAPRTVIALGGTAAIADAILADAAVAAGGAATQRLSGPDRVSTAARIAEEVVSLGGEVEEVWLATAGAYADALAAAATGAPVLLTGVDVLPAQTSQALAGLAPQTIRLAGGEMAISVELIDGLRHGER